MKNIKYQKNIYLTYRESLYPALVELSDSGMLHLTLTTPIGQSHNDEVLQELALIFVEALNQLGAESGFHIDSEGNESRVLGLAPPRNQKIQYMLNRPPEDLKQFDAAVANAAELPF